MDRVWTQSCPMTLAGAPAKLAEGKGLGGGCSQTRTHPENTASQSHPRPTESEATREASVLCDLRKSTFLLCFFCGKMRGRFPD